MDKNRIEGKAKELEGKVTGDESREAEGRIQGKYGEAKEGPGRMVEDLNDKVGNVFNEREERKERDRAAKR